MKPIFRSVRPAMAVAILCSLAASAGADVGLLNQCQASSASGVLEIAPDGSGPTLESVGLTIELQILDGLGNPVANYPVQDIWVGDNAGGTQLRLCGAPAMASAPTNADGRTTLTGSIAGGGFSDSGLQVYLGGVPLPLSPPLDIVVLSADFDGDLDVDSNDLVRVPGGFAYYFLNSQYDLRGDINGDGDENMLDLVRFADLYLSSASCP